MTLSLYFARRLAFAFLATMGVFAALLMLVEISELIGDYADEGRGFAAIAGLAALKVPARLHDILPLLALLSGLALFLALARSSELVVARAAGRSALRSLLVPGIAMGLIGVLLVGLFGPLASATARKAEAVEAAWSQDGSNVLSISEGSLWLRQSGGGLGQTVIRARAASLDGARLSGVTFVTYDSRGPATRIEAASAELTPGAWQLTQVKTWELNDSNPESGARTQDSVRLPTELTVESIRDSFGDPLAVPIWELPAFIASLEESGFSGRSHRMFLWAEIASPLFLVAMLLIAASFTMRHTRLGRTGLMMTLALVIGFTMYFLRGFALILGENGQVPIQLAAWAPPAAALLLATGFLLQKEDG